jgi:diguanylate cyclase (GGDEF)-like protein/PAS domain S-box-containing protein
MISPLPSDGWHFPLLAFCLLVALAAAYTGIDLAERIPTTRGVVTKIWLMFGAIAMGLGIWTMNFLGLAAAHAGQAVGFNVGQTVASLLIAVLALVSAFSLSLPAGRQPRHVLLGGLLMGSGTSAMHFIAAAAVRMPGYALHFKPGWFVFAVLIELAASTGALALVYYIRSQQLVLSAWRKALAAACLAAVIAGVHFMGDLANTFVPAPGTAPSGAALFLSHPGFAMVVGATTLLILAFTLLTSYFNQQVMLLAGRLIQSLQDSNQRLEEGVAERTVQLSEAVARLRHEIEVRQLREEELQHSEARFRATFEMAAVGISHTSLDGTLDRVNQKFCEIVGYTREQLQHLRYQQITHPDDLEQNLARNRQLLAGEIDTYRMHKRFIRPDASVIWVNLTVSLERDPESGAPRHLIAVLEDITERRHTEQLLEESHQRYRSLYEHHPDAVFSFDTQGLFTSCNEASTHISGYTMAELLYHPFAPMIVPEDMDRVLRHFRRVLDGEPQNYECRIQRKDTRIIDIYVTNLPIVVDGAIVGVYGIAQDISEHKEHEYRLAYLAQYDSLTGLPNRHLFRDRLAHAMQRATRLRQRVALMFLDLDKFKEINDNFGHETGDLILCQAAARIKVGLRESDTLARLGGDEFTVILEDVARLEHVETVAQKIMEVFAQPIVHDGVEFFVTASLGIALYPADDDNIDGMLKKADIAMYHAKDEGRNNYQFFTPDMNARAFERLSMKNQLRHALERDELFLHYQPQVDLHSGQIVGVEALLRWQHPEFGLVSPARFISLAEETGLIVPIGDWVLRTACRQCQAWQAAGLPPVRMAVNLSAQQLKQSHFVEDVRRILAETGLDPAWLELEITEGLLIENIHFSRAILRRLKEMGVHIALDDFGTGYSSLSYLKDLPLDILKMDGSFVRSLVGDDADHARAIISNIIALAHSLSLKVIAEGVETADQAGCLRANACDYVQGYLFSRPLAADVAAERLTRQAVLLPVASAE